MVVAKKSAPAADKRASTTARPSPSKKGLAISKKSLAVRGAEEVVSSESRAPIHARDVIVDSRRLDAVLLDLQDRQRMMHEQMVSRFDRVDEMFKLMFSTMSAMSKDIQSTNLTLQEHGKKLDQIDGRLAALELRVQRLEERVQLLEERIQRLEDRTQRIEDRLFRVEGEVQGIRLDIAILRKELDANRSEDRAAREALEARVRALEERVAA